jgi:hypothetical protein
VVAVVVVVDRDSFPLFGVVAVAADALDYCYYS